MFHKEVAQFIQEEALLTAGSRVLVACSGGVDSMVLLHYLTTYHQQFEIEVGAVHVDHMLRGEASVEDGRLVEAYCAHLSIPFYSGNVAVPKILEEFGGNVQEVCREGRYAFFEQVMKSEGYDQLVTGHHGDDQLETVLMQITKGLSPLGIPVKRGVAGGILVRPLLCLDKKSLYAYAKEYDVPFLEDSSNASDDYMRNRYRHFMIPKMIEENPAVVQGVVSMSAELRADEQLLHELAKEAVQAHMELTREGYPSMSVEYFQHMPTALQRRAILLLLDYLYDKENNGIDYKADLIQQMLMHLRSNNGSVSLDLPNGYQFTRAYDRFMFAPKQAVQRRQVELPKGDKVYWTSDEWFYWERVERVEDEVLSKAQEVAFFNLPSSSLPLTVRPRRDGDRIALKGMANTKRLSRLFIDEKVARSLRDQLPIVVTKQGEVCAVWRVRYGQHFTKQQTPESKYIFIAGVN